MFYVFAMRGFTVISKDFFQKWNQFAFLLLLLKIIRFFYGNIYCSPLDIFYFNA